MGLSINKLMHITLPKATNKQERRTCGKSIFAQQQISRFQMAK